VLPRGAPDFIEAATAYSRCDWLGVARGWVDPTKEAAGSVMRMDGGLSTLKKECAEQGLDWEEVIAQRAIEVAAFKRAGLTPPEWAGAVAAAEAAKPEENPQPR
jgi:capsid protein